MTPKERIYFIRLLEKMRRNPRYVEQIGIELRYVNNIASNEGSLPENNQFA